MTADTQAERSHPDLLGLLSGLLDRVRDHWQPDLIDRLIDNVVRIAMLLSSAVPAEGVLAAECIFADSDEHPVSDVVGHSVVEQVRNSSKTHVTKRDSLVVALAAVA